jgi:hypothetical protein
VSESSPVAQGTVDTVRPPLRNVIAHALAAAIVIDDLAGHDVALVVQGVQGGAAPVPVETSPLRKASQCVPKQTAKSM